MSATKRFDERKRAGRAVMKEIITRVQMRDEGDVNLAAIGGFALIYSGERFGQDGYRYTTILQRTASDYEVDLPVTTTPSGAISRIEHALSGFDAERDSYRHRLADAQRRLKSYQPRVGEVFPMEKELELKLDQLAEIEKDLAATETDAVDCVDPASGAIAA